MNQGLARFVLSAGVGLLSTTIATLPAIAAERITFFYPSFGQFSIPTQDLEIFAQENKLTDEFAFDAKRAEPEQLSALRDLLNQWFNISSVTVAQFTDSLLGENLLTQSGYSLWREETLTITNSSRCDKVAAFDSTTFPVDIYRPPGTSAQSFAKFLSGCDRPPQPTEWLNRPLGLTTPAKHLIVVTRGTHFSCLGGGRGGVLPVPEQLIGLDPEIAHPAVKAVSVAFFTLYLTQQMDDQPYLTPAYVSSISPSPFQWSVVRSLKLPLEFVAASTVSIPLQP